MKDSRKNNIRLGIFIIIGLALFVLLVYYIGSRKNAFTSTTTVHSTFNNVNGLKVGSNVRFAGINVGTVKGIQIISDSTVRVTLTIESSASQFVKKNSPVAISTEGLIGSKIVNILPGDEYSPSIEEGDQLPSVEPVTMDEVMDIVKRTGMNAQEITRDLSCVTSMIQRGEGLIGSLLADTTLDEDIRQIVAKSEVASNNLMSFSGNLKKISGQIEQGEGTLGRLVQDEQIANKLDHILDSLMTASSEAANMARTLSDFANKINSGDGPLNAIATDSSMSEDIGRLIQNINSAAKEINTTAEKLNNSWLLNGLLGGRSEEEREKR